MHARQEIPFALLQLLTSFSASAKGAFVHQMHRAPLTSPLLHRSSRRCSTGLLLWTGGYGRSCCTRCCVATRPSSREQDDLFEAILNDEVVYLTWLHEDATGILKSVSVTYSWPAFQLLQTSLLCVLFGFEVCMPTSWL